MITKKYRTIIKVSKADEEFLYVENTSNQTGTLTIAAGSNLGRNLEYTLDGTNWTTADPNSQFSLQVASGAKVRMRGVNSSWTVSGEPEHSIRMDVSHNVGGNVMSIVDKNSFTASTASCWFEALFHNDTSLVDASRLVLPATTLVSSCYAYMFQGCTSLTAAPELPATTLAPSCYNSMFLGCTSLTAAPALSAVSLASQCYTQMFDSCTSLSKVICLAENNGSGSTAWWLDGVSASGTFVKSSRSFNWESGINGIPSGWTVVNVQ